MTMNSKIVNTYLMQSMLLIALLTVLSFAWMWLTGNAANMLVAVCISAVFQLVACMAYGFLWKTVAASSQDSLPTLYMSASGFRMLAGVITVLAFCFATEDKTAIRFFVILFLIYYFVILIYDTAYFMKVEKKIRHNG